MQRKALGLLNLFGVLFGVIIIPPLCLRLYGADWSVIMAGGTSWAAALLIKAAAANQLLRKIKSRISNNVQAVVRGVLSAATELGMTAAAITAASLNSTPADMLSVGIGASSFEALYLIALSFYKATQRKPDRAALLREKERGEWSWIIRYMFVIERFTAGLIHVGSRSLVWLSIIRGEYGYAVMGFVSFALVDGTAAYGKLSKWNWFSPMTAKRFYLFVALLGSLDIAIFSAAIVTTP